MAEQNLMEQIRRRAYEIWLSEGRPHGRDRIHWLRAEAECREKLGAAQSQGSSGKAVLESTSEGGTKRRRTGRYKHGATRKGSKG
jgi:DUF2934 family protein